MAVVLKYRTMLDEAKVRAPFLGTRGPPKFKGALISSNRAWIRPVSSLENNTESCGSERFQYLKGRLKFEVHGRWGNGCFWHESRLLRWQLLRCGRMVAWEWVSVVKSWRFWQNYFWSSKLWFLHLLQGFHSLLCLTRPHRGEPAKCFTFNYSISHAGIYFPRFLTMPWVCSFFFFFLRLCECHTLSMNHSKYRRAAPRCEKQLDVGVFVCTLRVGVFLKCSSVRNSP